MAVKPIPEGYHSLTPYFVVDNAIKFIEFVEKVFDGKVSERMMQEDKVRHCEMQVGDSKMMVADSMPEYPANPMIMYHYVANVDEVYNKAIKAGAKCISEPADMFYGDRHGGVIDPVGNKWWIATRIENVSEEELKARAAKHQQGSCASTK